MTDSRAATTPASQRTAPGEGLFARMADASPVLIWRSRADKSCDYFNRRWLEFRGRRHEDEIRDGWSEGVHPEDLDTCLRTYNEAFDARVPFRMEYRLRRRDGVYRWILDEGAPFHDAEGRFQGYIGSCIDITDHREAEERLRRTERRWRDLLDHAPHWILRLDDEGRILYGNRLPGGPGGIRFLGRSALAFVSRADRSRLRCALEAARRGQPVESMEVSGRRALGRRSWFACQLAPLHAMGSVPDVVLVASEITAIRDAESARQRSEEVLHTVIENVPLIVFATDAEGTITLSEGRALASIGLKPGDGVGENIFQRYADRPIAFKHIRRALAGERFTALVDTEWKRTFRCYFAPILDAAGDIQGMTGVLTDVTQQKQAEAGARHRREQLERVWRLGSLGLMAAGLAHEVNQPLAAITNYARGCIHRLRSGLTDPQTLLEPLERMAAEAERAAQVVRDLRHTLEAKEPRRQPVALGVLLRETAELFRESFERLGVIPNLEVAETCPQVLVNANQVEQVLRNLIENALDSMAHVPPVQRELTLRAESCLDGEAEIAVLDRGAPVEVEDLEELFLPFYTTKEEGMGLGLSISRRIAESLGGRLTAERREGGGLALRLWLPLVLEEA